VHNIEHKPLRNMEIEKLLNAFSIGPTARRIQILKVILNSSSNGFTIAEIDYQIKTENPSAGTSSVINTLALFKNTGLIKEVNNEEKPNRKKGRPEMKFYLSNEIHSIDSMKMVSTNEC
jgi:Fe2+ or Zn2+ uptake regulation protein